MRIYAVLLQLRDVTEAPKHTPPVRLFFVPVRYNVSEQSMYSWRMQLAVVTQSKVLQHLITLHYT